MTDYPIPDELRDEFARAAARSQFDAGNTAVPAARAWLDSFARHGFRIELRLPEFAVHDGTCCGGSGEKTIVHEGASWEAGRRIVQEVPCPGVGYYHWTVAVASDIQQPGGTP